MKKEHIKNKIASAINRKHSKGGITFAVLSIMVIFLFFAKSFSFLVNPTKLFKKIVDGEMNRERCK